MTGTDEVATEGARADGRAEGVVQRVDAKLCHVRVGERVVAAAPRGTLFDDLGDAKNPVAVGDRVLLDLEGDPVRLTEVLPRRNYLGRTASSHDPREQVLAANVDQLLVIASIREPRFSSSRTDRILAACEWHQIPAMLVLNKADLARGSELEDVVATYRAVPVPVLVTSAPRGLGLDELRATLEGRMSVLYGASGAGKSSLVNALQPSLELKVGRISRYWEQGKHTTSFSQMHPLDFGGAVIDTPGIRVFRLHRVHHSELKGLFPDLARLGPRCRFPDCTHHHEPDCAVFEAVEAGALAESRYHSYLELLAEALPDPLPEDEPIGAEEDEEPESDAAS